MIAPEFLALLVCPVSRQPLREATADELARVNRAIDAGGWRDRGGTVVAEPVAAGLVVIDLAAAPVPAIPSDRAGAAAAWLYPIRDGLPILLGPAAIPLPPA